MVAATTMQTSIGQATMLILASTYLALVSRALAHDTVEDEQINEVFIRMEDGRTLTLDFEPNEKLFDLKLRIEEHEEILWQRQKLSLDDRKLEGNMEKLSDLGIKAGANLTLTLRLLKAETYVHVNLLTGKTIYIEVDLAQPAKRLKESVTRWLAYVREPHTNLRLTFNNHLLRDDRKLLAYPIEAGSTIMQGKQLDDCRADAEIIVRTLSGATIRCQVDLAGTVAELERSIETQTGVPREAQVLGYGENRLRSEDYLCDHGLATGSSVNLAFYSRRVKVPGDIRRLRLPLAKSPHDVPIFCEANDNDDAIFNDEQNWLFESRKFADIMDLFDQVAQLELNKQERQRFEQLTQDMLTYGLVDNIDLYETLLARTRMHSVVSRYQSQITSNQNNINRYDGHGGIQLGASWQPGGHLGANINNYVPDAFSDDGIMSIFEKSAIIRRQSERGARMSADHLTSLVKQKEMNSQLLKAYRESLRGIQPAVEILDEELLDSSDCPICHDVLAAELAVKLPCNHAIHLDCIKGWVQVLRERKQPATCPCCRERFKL